MKSKKGKVPDCSKCDYNYTIPIESNFQTLGLIERYSGMFKDGMGGINAEGIRLALDAEEIPDVDRPSIIQKLIVYIIASNTEK